MSLMFQLLGSLAVLAAFALSQWRVLDQKSLTYLLLNVIGSGVLAADAVYEEQWGFLILEGAWAVVSLFALVKLIASRRAGDRAASS